MSLNRKLDLNTNYAKKGMRCRWSQAEKHR